MKLLLMGVGVIAIVIVVAAMAGRGKSIAELSCADVTSQAEGMSFRNAFGVTTDILKITNVALDARDDNSITCTGTALLESGGDKSISMRVFEEGGDRFIGVEAL